MTPWWVLALVSVGGAVVGGLSAYLVGVANDRRQQRARRLAEVRRLLAEFISSALMMAGYVMTEEDRLRRGHDWPASDPTESARFDSFEADFRISRGQLQIVAARSRMMRLVNNVDEAVGQAVSARTDTSDSPTKRSREVQRAADVLYDVLRYLNERGDRYLDRELRTPLTLNPVPIAILNTREPPGYARAWFLRRKLRLGVRRIQARGR